MLHDLLLFALMLISGILLEPMRCFASEGSLIPQPLPVLLDAPNLLSIVVRHGVLHRLPCRVHPIPLDVFVEVVVLLCNLLCILPVQQAPDRVADGRTGEPAETGTCECETSIDVDGVETSDGVARIDFEGEEVGTSGSTGEEGGWDGSDHAC